MIPLAIKHEPAADAAAVHVEERRSGRIVGWLRELFRPEQSDARRQRIVAEAAAELGLTTPQQTEPCPAGSDAAPQEVPDTGPSDPH